MASIKPCWSGWRVAAFLCFVARLHCVTAGHPLSSSSSDNTSVMRSNQTIKSDLRENLNFRPARIFDRNNKLRTHFYDDNKEQTLAYNDNPVFELNQNFLPRNKIRCPPCFCKNTSLNLVTVFCSDCMFISIPQNFSIEMGELIINHCDKLKALDLNTLMMYTSLTRVKITTYSINKVICSSRSNISSTVIELDLSGNWISTVEDNCFCVFPSLIKLSIAWNDVQNITKPMFTGLHSLRYLSLSRNLINFIASDTFDDLGNLVILDISENKIIYTGYELLPVRIFIPLMNLEELYINDVCDSGTYQCGSYPNKAIRVLTKLRVLRIDGADSRGLGPEIKSLAHLRHLIIVRPVSFNLTAESYFDNVPLITTLDIGVNVNPKSFTRLTQLVNLNYSLVYRYSNICRALNDMQYLVGSSLKYLKILKVNVQKNGCNKLKAQEAKYISLLRLIELDLSENALVDLSPKFIEMLPATLKKINLSHNGLSPKIINLIHFLPNELIELNLSYQNNYYKARSVDEEVNQLPAAVNIPKKNTSVISTVTESDDSSGQHILKYKRIFRRGGDSKPNGINLRFFRVKFFKNVAMYLRAFLLIISSSSLKEISLAGCELSYWTQYKLMANVEEANFSNNYASSLNQQFFPVNSSLKYLSMSNNLFGQTLDVHTESLFFENAGQLVALDMSRNFIITIPDDYFRNQVNLEILDISQNKLQTINLSFSHMKKLRFLDFSANSITSIGKRSRDDLDLLAADHQVYLDLTSNPLPCTCEGLELMKWMAFTNVYLLSQDFLVCRNEFDQGLEIGNIVQRVETLQRQCALKTVIILTCVFSIIVFGILLLTSVMYRYRWKLRYLRSIALMKVFGSRAGVTNKIGYRFDAYILYTDDTRRFVVRDCVLELEEKRGHRLCIEERDFLPGTYNVSNIVSGVQNSANTVAMVTPEFYQGEYSKYSVKMALMEEIFMRRSVLFLCLCEPTDDKDLSHDLLTAMKQNNYIEYPPRDDVTDDIIDEFWNQFSLAIGRNDL